MSRPATARQLGHIDRLVAERDTAGMVIPRHLAHLDRVGASRLITELEQQPRRPTAEIRPRTVPVNLNGAGPGVYEIGGDVFRLRVNGAGTAVYPERLVAHVRPPRWEYAPDVARRVLPSQRIPPEDAARLAGLARLP